MTEPTKRLTLTDAYRDAQHVIDQLTTRSASEPSATVELARNAKGDVQFSVKVYAAAGAEDAAVEAATSKAYDQATQAFESLRVAYPLAHEGIA